MAEDLRTKALLADTPGRWDIYVCTTTLDNPRGGQWVHGPGGYYNDNVVAMDMKPNDARFIAAASPAAILELYAEIDALKAKLRGE